MEDENIRRVPEVGMSPRYRLFRYVMVILGRLFLGFEVHGEEKVPKSGPLIVASNHRRYADPVFVCMAVPRRFQWMAKKEVFVFPFKEFFYFIGAFPVDRQKGGRGALRNAISLLTAGWTLGIFPEGTRRQSYDPKESPKSGVAMLAARANAPILPMFVGDIPTPLQRLKGKKLHIYIGNSITTDNTKTSGRDHREVTARVLDDIYALGGKSP